MVDLPGMGLSSKHDFYNTFNSSEHWLEYFIGCLKDFFRQLKITKFFLVGHSMGALISFHYLTRNSNQIEKLILLSPAGFNPADDNARNERDEYLWKKGFIWRHLTLYLEKKVYEEKKNLFDYLCKPLWPFVIKKYLKDPRFGLNDSQIHSLYKIIEYTIFDKHSSYQCLPYLLFVMKSPIPIR